MKTMIKALAFTGLVLAASAAKADYLYWMINDLGSKYAFSYAQLKVYGSDDTYLAVATVDPSSSGNPSYKFYAADSGTATSMEASWADLASYGSGSRFLVELYSTKDDLVGTLKTVTYTALNVAGSIVSTMSSSATPYAFSASDVIPEPCTGLLGLLGLGVIGLRKRFKKAKKA